MKVVSNINRKGFQRHEETCSCKESVCSSYNSYPGSTHPVLLFVITIRFPPAPLLRKNDRRWRMLMQSQDGIDTTQPPLPYFKA